MNTLIKQCELFKNINQESVIKLLNNINYHITKYTKNQIIANEGDVCNRIGIILTGQICMQNFLVNGEVSTVGKFNEGKMFGEVLVFGDYDRFPATIISTTDTEILYISNEDLLSIFEENKIVLNNFLNLLTKRIFYLNNRIKLMNQGSIRSKISYYLLEHYRRTTNLKVHLGMTKEELAELLNVQRPSLSRELSRMKEEAIIEYNRHSITIVNLEALEECIR